MFDFETALQCMREGYKVRRDEWDLDTKYIKLMYPSFLEKREYIKHKAVIYTKVKDKFDEWIPRSEDILAEDWTDIIEGDK